MKRHFKHLETACKAVDSSGVKPAAKRLRRSSGVAKRKNTTRIINIPASIRQSRKSSDCITIKDKDLLIDYYPFFFSHKVSDEYLEKLDETIEYNTDEDSAIILYGKKTFIPRKQTAYGDPNVSYKFSNTKVSAKPWQDNATLLKIKEKVETALKKDEYQTNFVLINRYADGSKYIGEHRDDEKDLIENASIVGISFGSERDFVLKHENVKSKRKQHLEQPPLVKIALLHGSMIVLKYPTNQFWYHSVPKRANVKQPRVSLTFRHMHSEDEKNSTKNKKISHSDDEMEDFDVQPNEKGPKPKDK